MFGVKTNTATIQTPHTMPRFRHFLQSELARRCTRNPQYSLRAFAKYLQIEPATLSQLLRGTRKTTPASIRKLGMRLGLDEASIGSWISRETARVEDSSRLQRLEELTRETSAVVSEWHHYAILELTRLQDFVPDVRWISRVLGVSQDQVAVALQRLLRLGLLEMTSREQWQDRSGDTTATLLDFADTAVRMLYQQSRALLLAALQAAPAGCEYSSTTVAVDRHRLPEAIGLLRKMQRDTVRMMQNRGKPNDVYQLEISLFPLTRLQQKESLHGTSRHAMADHHQESRPAR